ncbi:sugar ABC transporter substrate-binding protein [Rossellomorea vietnamensis]|uniref:Sugar ABC transporter substrate-binding protein n=1 Tax=Rossellomorea vietnamensis TaxID=218284 RepID=A0A5D4NUM4_9BACI|nr:sugar ABC transporter substrate-binding protein [Rossellomorea vietnamensis]TYS18035.1 sugar ABC transporter substrate-binding protein [Rossellomorea vietnamensis]
MNKLFKWKPISIILSLTLLLGACSSGESSGGESDDTLNVWTMSGALDEFVTEFEDENGVTVKVQTIPWANAHDKLLTAVASGKGPDVLQIGTTWVAEFAEAGTFLDLTEHLDDYENLNPENFYEGAIGTTTFEEETIAIPWYVDTRLLFYRTDLLGEVGYPEGPDTWDEMTDASRQLAARGEGQYAIDMPKSDPQFPFMLAWQQGWDYEVGKGSENFNSAEFKEAIELHHLYYEEELSQMEKGKEFFQAFADGSKPMFFSGPWDIGTIKDRAPEIEGQWDVHVMPEAENNKSMMGGAHLAVFNNTEKVDLALDFINWMADAETQVEWYKANSELPANMAAWEDPVLADDPMVSTFGEQLESTQPLPLIPEFERLGQELLSQLEEINRGGKDIEEAIADYKDTAANVLSE